MNEYKTHTTAKGICATSFCLLIATMLFQMHVTNETALKGRDFKDLYEKKKGLEKEIARLKFEDANLSSLTYVETRAYELGYVKMTGSIVPLTPPALASLGTQ